MREGRRSEPGRAGLLLILLVIVLQQCVGGGIGLPGSDSDGGSQQQDTTAAGGYAECQTSADANKSEKCARKPVALSLENFWTAQFQSGFQPAKVITFSGSVSTPAAGPAPRWARSTARRTSRSTSTRRSSTRSSRASSTARAATSSSSPTCSVTSTDTNDEGVKIFEDIDDQDIEEAIGAAFTVGDDHIQKTTGGRVDVDAWTHGSSEQRMESFKIGYSTDGFDACDWSNLPQS